jgi:hypothetical protein
MKTLLLTLIITLSFTAITIAQVPSYVPTNGLVGWWPFNGNANDESANGNNGTNNGATLTSDRFGNVNSAYSFDGTDDFINMPEDSTMELNQHTISFWFNSSILPNGRFDLIGKDNTTGNRQYVIQLESSGVIRNGVFTNIQPYIIDGNTIITTNNWINVLVTWDGIINRTYINSNLDTSISTLGNLLQDNWDLFFGGIPSFNQYYFGKLDDIGFWSRALTQQEITDLYNGCQLTVSTHPNTQQININNNAQFIVGSSDPNATYQWQTDLGVGFQNLNSVGQYSGTTNDTLNVANVTMSNNNQPFRCIISSGSCSDTSNAAVLSVNNNVGINEFSKDNLFSVFPNPAQNVINIKAEAKLIGNIYSIFDNTGRVILTGKIKTENTSIELGNLSSGIYLISVEGINKQTFRLIRE